MKHPNYIITIHRDGRYKVRTAERYRLLRALKSVGIILGALLVAALFCGAAVISEHPAKIAQAIFLFGASAVALISAIVWSVTGGGEEKNKNNGKTSERR